MRAQQGCCCERFVRRDVSARCHDNIRLLAVVIACPFPDADALCAVSNSLIHCKILQVLLFVSNNDIDVVFTTEAMVHGRKQAVCIWREVDANNLRALVRHYI